MAEVIEDDDIAQLSAEATNKHDDLFYIPNATLIPPTTEPNESQKEYIYKMRDAYIRLSSSYYESLQNLLSSELSNSFEKQIIELSSRVNNVTEKIISCDNSLKYFDPSFYIANTHPEKTNTKGLDVNYSHSNQWYASFYLENILGKTYNDLILHLTRFSIPQLEMASTEVSWRGYSIEIPTKVLNPATKQLTLEYVVDDNWRNYKALYTWMSGTEGNINKVTDDDINPITPSEYIPLHIYLLDNYKKKIIEFEYRNCWIKTFNDIALDVNEKNEVHHSFTICYTDFSIVKSEDAK